jgi:hypothetical protein
VVLLRILFANIYTASRSRGGPAGEIMSRGIDLTPFNKKGEVQKEALNLFKNWQERTLTLTPTQLEWTHVNHKICFDSIFNFSCSSTILDFRSEEMLTLLNPLI